LAFKSDGSIITGTLLTAGFIFAERIGSYIEGPFDKDGSTFSLRQNEICSLITKEMTTIESISQQANDL
jgi:putative membrane protein